MARVSVLGERPESVGGPSTAQMCPREAASLRMERPKGEERAVVCTGAMRTTGQTMTAPAWGHDLLALLRCDVCGERAWYRQVVAYEELPGDVEF